MKSRKKKKGERVTVGPPPYPCPRKKGGTRGKTPSLSYRAREKAESIRISRLKRRKREKGGGAKYFVIQFSSREKKGEREGFC